jgi:hypothetical protein
MVLAKGLALAVTALAVCGVAAGVTWSYWLSAPAITILFGIGFAISCFFAASLRLRLITVLEMAFMVIASAAPVGAHREGHRAHPTWLTDLVLTHGLPEDFGLWAWGGLTLLLVIVQGFGRLVLSRGPKSVTLPAVGLGLAGVLVALTITFGLPLYFRERAAIPPPPSHRGTRRPVEQQERQRSLAQPPEAKVALVHLLSGPPFEAPTWINNGGLIVSGHFFRERVYSAPCAPGEDLVPDDTGCVLEEPNGVATDGVSTNVLVRVFSGQPASLVPVGAVASAPARPTTSMAYPWASDFTVRRQIASAGMPFYPLDLTHAGSPFYVETNWFINPSWTAQTVTNLLAVPTNPVTNPDIARWLAQQQPTSDALEAAHLAWNHSHSNSTGALLAGCLHWATKHMVLSDKATEPPRPGREGAVSGDLRLLALTQTVLLRQAGVPCRLVEGYRFVSTDGQARDRFLLTSRHRFWWPEVWMKGSAWVPVPARVPVAGHAGTPVPSLVVDLPQLRPNPANTANSSGLEYPKRRLTGRTVTAALVSFVLVESALWLMTFVILPVRDACLSSPPCRTATVLLRTAAIASRSLGRSRQGKRWEDLWASSAGGGFLKSQLHAKFSVLAKLNALAVEGASVSVTDLVKAYHGFARLAFLRWFASGRPFRLALLRRSLAKHAGKTPTL